MSERKKCPEMLGGTALPRQQALPSMSRAADFPRQRQRQLAELDMPSRRRLGMPRDCILRARQ
ncbi:hypothetical protein XH84_14980 [Bradyrhizobium nanningense]|nr:hypothetical protein XH84_14980 [Bradyrhizobium nanningense]